MWLLVFLVITSISLSNMLMTISLHYELLSIHQRIQKYNITYHPVLLNSVLLLRKKCCRYIRVPTPRFHHFVQQHPHQQSEPWTWCLSLLYIFLHQQFSNSLVSKSFCTLQIYWGLQVFFFVWILTIKITVFETKKS